MGSKLGQRAVTSPKNLTDFFEECCPVYMSIGMSYKEFWEGDVSLPGIYMKAYKLKRNREIQDMNFSAWLNGLYTAKAYGVVLSNAFSKKGTAQAQYFSEPIPLGEEEKPETPEQKEKREEAELLRTQIALDNWVKGMSEMIKDKG